MDWRIQEYVQEVIRYVTADEATKARLSEDLCADLQEVAAAKGVQEAIAQMGPAEDLARELTDMLNEDRPPRTHEAPGVRPYREYTSRTRVFGLPLVHVRLSNGSGRPVVAKGIIAVGDVALGVVAVGGISVGVVSLGGVSAGLLLALGGVALGGLALGGLAIGLLAMGGVAVGLCAFGGVAAATHFALGDTVSGHVAIGRTVQGTHTILVEGGLFDVPAAQVRELLQTAYPNLPAFLLRLVASLFR